MPLNAGSTYLRVVAPSYGFFGVGLMLHFASQGRSNMLWPFVAGVLRLAVTVAGQRGLPAAEHPSHLLLHPLIRGVERTVSICTADGESEVQEAQAQRIANHRH